MVPFFQDGCNLNFSGRATRRVSFSVVASCPKESESDGAGGGGAGASPAGMFSPEKSFSDQ
jgi:hypothetical protein